MLARAVAWRTGLTLIGESLQVARTHGRVVEGGYATVLDDVIEDSFRLHYTILFRMSGLRPFGASLGGGWATGLVLL